MAVISRDFVDEYARRNMKLSESGARALAELLEGIDLDNTDAVVTAMRYVCVNYSEMSAALAAQFYDELRLATYAGNLSYDAAAYSGYNAEYAQIDALGIINEVDAGRNTRPMLDLLQNVVIRAVKNSADNSIRENARRDPAKPKYAIVPRGDACAFCIMRASLGYHYPEKSYVESHEHCTCTATPVFSESTVQGYDPAVYAHQYYDAVRALDSGDIPEKLQRRMDSEKARKGKDYTRTNKVLAVMRYQQGIS